MIQLNTENHSYTKDGIPVPGVTKVIREAGLVDFSMIPADIMERAQKYGTATHLACELYDRGTLDDKLLDPLLRGSLNAWIKFRKDTGFVPLGIEEKVYSAKYGYAGTLDRRGMLHDIHSLIDLKSGADFGKATGPQTAAYENAVNEKLPFKQRIKKRYSVLLKENGLYKIEPYEGKSDFSVFLAALTLRNWRMRNG